MPICNANFGTCLEPAVPGKKACTFHLAGNRELAQQKCKDKKPGICQANLSCKEPIATDQGPTNKMCMKHLEKQRGAVQVQNKKPKNKDEVFTQPTEKLLYRDLASKALAIVEYCQLKIKSLRAACDSAAEESRLALGQAREIRERAMSRGNPLTPAEEESYASQMECAFAAFAVHTEACSKLKEECDKLIWLENPAADVLP